MKPKVTKSPGRNAVDARRRVVQNTIDQRPIKEETYAEEQKRKQPKRPKFTHARGITTLFKRNYIILLLMTALVIGNCIGHAFKGDFEFIIINVLFLGLFIFSLSYVDPLAYASDRKHYRYPKFNLLYNQISRLTQALLRRIGENLTIKPDRTLIAVAVFSILGSIVSILFYNSDFIILALPIFLVYVARIFAANQFKAQTAKLGTLKWALFLLFAIDCLLSIWWRTSISFSLFVLISFINSTQLLFRNLEIYSPADSNFS